MVFRTTAAILETDLRMSNVKGPWGAYVGLLALSFLAVVDYAEGQQIICSQKDPASCPTGQYCDNNGMCVPLKTGSDKTTTYVILGCVLGGVVIIVAVIIILYCGRWSWLARLKDRFGRGQGAAMTSGITSQYQQTPGMTWAKSLRKRFKLKLGGVKRNPYVGQPGPSGASAPNLNAANWAPNANNPPNTVANRAPTPNLTVNVATPAGEGGGGQLESASRTPYVATVEPAGPQESIQTRYVVGGEGGGGGQLESASRTPYVATVELSGDDPVQTYDHSLYDHSHYAVEAYPDARQRPPVTQVYYPQPSPRLLRPQINIQSPLPHEQIVVPVRQLEAPAVLEPAAPPPVVPHTHQVYPSLYPSLGHGHTHAPATAYGELPIKY